MGRTRMVSTARVQVLVRGGIGLMMGGGDGVRLPLGLECDRRVALALRRGWRMLDGGIALPFNDDDDG